MGAIRSPLLDIIDHPIFKSGGAFEDNLRGAVAGVKKTAAGRLKPVSLWRRLSGQHASPPGSPPTGGGPAASPPATGTALVRYNQNSSTTTSGEAPNVRVTGASVNTPDGGLKNLSPIATVPNPPSTSSSSWFQRLMDKIHNNSPGRATLIGGGVAAAGVGTASAIHNRELIASQAKQWLDTQWDAARRGIGNLKWTNIPSVQSRPGPGAPAGSGQTEESAKPESSFWSDYGPWIGAGGGGLALLAYLASQNRRKRTLDDDDEDE